MFKKIAVITGGASGIGRALAEGFLAKGYQVVTLDIMANTLKEVDFYQIDVSNKAELENTFKEITKRYGGAHILINNAAISKFNKPVMEMTPEEFKKVIDINLNGAFMCSLEFIKANKGMEFGRIINLASTRWGQNEPGWDAYGASKGGIVSLTASMAVSLSGTGITVNAVSPGWIQVENYAELDEIYHSQHPAGRVGKPEDIFNICFFLAQEENGFIDGANILVDGGMSKKMFYQDKSSW